MAVGGVPPYSGINNIIIGTNSIDYIFGDPYTTGSPYGQQTGGALSSGRGGNDRLEGLGGDDKIYGDAYFMDTVGIGGNDRLGGGAGDDLLVGDADQLSGAARGGDDLIEGGEGNDEIYGDGRFMLGQSRGGNDVIYGGGGADYVAGDAFYLVDSGIGGNDVIYGGAGDDFSLVGDARGLFNDAQGGHDRIYGGVGNDMVAGDADTMRDNARGGDDFIVGGAGDDELFGDAETYTNYTGVGGQDRFFFALGSGRDRIGDFELGKDLIQIAYAYGFKTFSQLQSRISDDEFGNAVIHLNGSTDQITVLGVASHQLSSADFLFSDEAIRGSSGNNVMNPTTSVAAYRTTASNDVVFGLDGNDVIDGGTGADKMDGGNGNDTFFVDSYTDDGLATNDDQVIEIAGGGKDLVNASVSYRLADNVENLTLIGSAAINGTGNDLGNAIIGNAASNTLTGGLGNDELYAKEGDDTLFGGNGADTLDAGAGDDILDGGAGSDLLKGREGADTLIGGSDGDTLFGGTGADRFVFNTRDASASVSSLDIIGDFRSGEDVIDLHFTVPLPPAAYAEAATSSTDYASALTVAESLIGGGRVAVYVAGAADGWLFWDSLGDGVIDQAVVLKGANSLAAFGTYDII